MTDPRPSSDPGRRPEQPARSGPPDPDAGHPRLAESVAWNTVSYLISGPVLGGLAGWGLDSWLGTAFLLPVGILAGMALSLYLVWFRYGTQ